eukprot:357291-Chlamydomonas_euryale.AAC.2
MRVLPGKRVLWVVATLKAALAQAEVGADEAAQARAHDRRRTAAATLGSWVRVTGGACLRSVITGVVRTS